MRRFFEIIQIRTSFMPCLISEGNMGWSENKVPSIPAGLSSLFPIIPIKIAIWRFVGSMYKFQSN